ncbi:periplasmic heavy metal sensor [Parvibaculum sp.]|uniref:periplasmic heavy metal sensor n=1 Tax=Parvibaculum sp. TaxID=2024848 RepID=UPI00320F9182
MNELPANEAQARLAERRWVGPALLVSLIINLFLVGMIAAALIFGTPVPPGVEPGRVPAPFFKTLHKGADGLPPGDRAAMRKIMIDQFPLIKPRLAALETARRELADALGAPTYDAARVAAAFAKVDTVQAEISQAARTAMIQGFSRLTPEQRARVADSMRRRAEHRFGPAAGPGAPDGPDGPDGPKP